MTQDSTAEMQTQTPETQADDTEKVVQQYERFPYPLFPIEQNPREKDDNLDQFFIHSLVTADYLRNQRVINLQGKLMLDAGCGSGYQALRMAQANPEARIVGIDLSPESVRRADLRLKYHGFTNAEFHALSIEELPQLGMAFDYIDCDEVLYLLPDPAEGLKILQSVLKPEGIIRTNLHSRLQREPYYRAQELFSLMGLMDDPGSEEVAAVRETMTALKDTVNLKRFSWMPMFYEDKPDESVMMNHLIQHDKGYTVPEMFAMLQEANLELISIVNWRDWELLGLFEDADNLPSVWAFSLPDLEPEDRLRIYELLNPFSRLLDFWCGHPGQGRSPKPVPAWDDSDWQRAMIHLNPLLQTDAIRQDVLQCIAEQKPFELSRYIALPTLTPIQIESSQVASLLPLWDGPQSLSALVSRFLTLHPIDRMTLEPTQEAIAVQHVQQLITKLETFLYVMVELKAI